MTLIHKVERKTASNVTSVILKLLKPIAGRVHTLTSDNGKEFAGHETIAKDLGARFFFAHPYASWERGLNVNTNGLIRQYFPKHRDFTTITQTESTRRRINSTIVHENVLALKHPIKYFLGSTHLLH